MKRIAFTIGGDHGALYDVRDRLIKLGYWLVPEGSTDPAPDFRVYGGAPYEYNGDIDIACLLRECPDFRVPTIVLSSGDVYSDVEDKKVPFKEDDMLIVPSVYDSDLCNVLYSLIAENYFLEAGGQTLVLRTFNLYGAGAKGTIRNMFRRLDRKEQIVIPPPGYQVNTWLHIDDFLSAIEKLIPKFLKGAQGVYNIGSKEEISYNRLADSVWQLVHTDGSATLTTPNPRWVQPWYTVPDITRIQALLNWKPQISIRKGLWMHVNQKTNV
jgi:nucleoside-diphosphate-sugar epimerase